MENKKFDSRHQNMADKSTSTSKPDKGFKKESITNSPKANSISNSNTTIGSKEQRSPLTERNATKSAGTEKSFNDHSNRERVDHNPMANEGYDKIKPGTGTYDGSTKQSGTKQGEDYRDGQYHSPSAPRQEKPEGDHQPSSSWDKNKDTDTKNQSGQKSNWNSQSEVIEEPDSSKFKKDKSDIHNKQDKSQSQNQWKPETDGL